MMRRLASFLFICCLAGCSTHPIVDFRDYFFPGKMGPNVVQPYGGVGIPQGAIIPVAPSVPGIIVPGAGVVPPPAPLPGNRFPQLQPPSPADIPPPPTPPNFPR